MAFLKPNHIYLGDSRQKLRQIEPGSVSLSVWSPPYFVGKDYERGETYESWQDMLRTVIHHHHQVLRPGGFMVINIADILCFQDERMPKIQAQNLANRRSPITLDMVLEAKRQHPDWNRDRLARLLGCSEQTIDRRLHGNNIRGGKYQTQTRVKLVGGTLEAYAYDAGLYLYDHRIWVKDPAWANSRWTTNTLKAVQEYEDLYVFWKPGEYVIDRTRLTPDEWTDWGSRSVWSIQSVRKNDEHEAMFPIELVKRLIRLFTDPGDLVLDPFMGSGTTALAAVDLGRDYIGIEKVPEYVRLARESIAGQRQHRPRRL